MLTMSDFHGQFPAKENRFKVCNKDTETMSKAKFAPKDVTFSKRTSYVILISL